MAVKRAVPPATAEAAAGVTATELSVGAAAALKVTSTQ